MNATKAASKPVPAANGDVPLDESIALWAERVRQNPRRFIMPVIVLGAVAVAVIVGVKSWRSNKEAAETNVAGGFLRAAAAAAKDEWTESVAILNDAAKHTAGTPAEPQRLHELALAYSRLAEKANSQAEKLEAWRNCAAAAGNLESKFPASIWARMPVKPGVVDPGVKSITTSLKSLAEEQLKWLEANPFAAEIAPDKDLSVTFDLEDGRKIVLGKFYSRAAPTLVQNFVNLARDGYFDGTGFGTLERWFKKTATRSFDMSPVGLRGGDAMTRVTPADRTDDNVDSSIKNDLPYSLPEEQSVIVIGRGTVTARYDIAAGGCSPTRFSIYNEELQQRPDGVPFAMVTEGLDVLDGLVKADVEPDRPETLKALTRIKKATVQGSVEFPPVKNSLPKFTPESLPKAPADAKTVEAATTSAPASR